MLHYYSSDLLVKICDKLRVVIPLDMCRSFPIMYINGELIGCVTFKHKLPSVFDDAYIAHK